jgi:hypothetical protein
MTVTIQPAATGTTTAKIYLAVSMNSRELSEFLLWAMVAIVVLGITILAITGDNAAVTTWASLPLSSSAGVALPITLTQLCRVRRSSKALRIRDTGELQILG